MQASPIKTGYAAAGALRSSLSMPTGSLPSLSASLQIPSLFSHALNHAPVVSTSSAQPDSNTHSTTESTNSSSQPISDAQENVQDVDEFDGRAEELSDDGMELVQDFNQNTNKLLSPITEESPGAFSLPVSPAARQAWSQPVTAQSMHHASTYAEVDSAVESDEDVDEPQRRNANAQPQPRTALQLKAEISAWTLEQRGIKAKLQTARRDVTELLNRAAASTSVIDETSLASCVDEFRDIDQSVVREEKRVFAELSKMSASVKQLKSSIVAVQHAKPMPDAQQLLDLKTLMDAIEDDLLTFKKKQRERYTVLNDSARALEVELPLLLERFESWDREPTAATEPTKVRKVPTVSAKAVTSAVDGNEDGDGDDETEQTVILRQKVQRLQDMIAAEGGSTGHWQQTDHDQFLKLRARYGKNHGVFLERCAAAIPNMTMEQCTEHAHWYARHVRYAQELKDVTAEWRQAREKAKSAHRQRELELLQAASAAANKPVDELTEQQRQQQAVAVRQWRLQKQREAELATSAKQQAESLKIQAERAKVEEQRIRAAEMLSARRPEIEAAKQAQQAAQLEKERREREARRVSAEQAEKLAAKNDALVRKRLEAQQRIESEKLERQQRLQELAESVQPAYDVERDPNRLINETRSAKARREQIEAERQRQKEMGGTRGASAAQSLMFNAPRMVAVPSWRSGV